MAPPAPSRVMEVRSRAMRGEERETAHLGPRLCARTISGDSSWSVTSYILDVAELTRDTSYIYPIHLSVSAFLKSLKILTEKMY